MTERLTLSHCIPGFTNITMSHPHFPLLLLEESSFSVALCYSSPVTSSINTVFLQSYNLGLFHVPYVELLMIAILLYAGP